MLRTLFILLVYIVAPALLIYWATVRIRVQHRPHIAEVVMFLLAAILLGMLMYSMTDKLFVDADAGLNKFVSELKKSYDFPVAAKSGEGPAVYGQTYPRFLDIRIYGVNSAQEQDKVAEIARQLHSQYARKPVLLQFIREEIWLQNADGSRIPLRDKEVSLRQIRLE